MSEFLNESNPNAAEATAEATTDEASTAPEPAAARDAESEAASAGAAAGLPTEVALAAWQEVLDVLQAELSGPTYNNYLRQIVPIGLGTGALTLQVPSDFVKDWLMRRFSKRIEETLAQFLGRPVLLNFQSAPTLLERPTSGNAADATTITDDGDGAAAAAEPTRLAGAEAAAEAALQGAERGRGNANFTLDSGDRRAAAAAASSKAARDLAALEDFSSSPLNRKYTFENFIVGRSNYVSHAAAWAVANAPAKGQYNPLFIYGGVGLGKTHLMQAIGHHINKSRGNPAEIIYVSGENFLYQVVRCIREDRMTAFRRMYRNVDIWLVDDIQYICNAERTEVEFFHIFNTLFDQGKQIVICADKPPKELQLTESRLLSRFEWGLISYVEPPDLEHRIAILQKRAQAEGVNVDPAVLQYLAEKIRSNIRSLEGSLTRLLAMASLDGRRINLELAAETVRHYSTAQSEPVKVDVQIIISVVADYFKIDVAELLGKKRNKEIVLPRQIAMYLAREISSMSYPDIGRAFARDYTTVIHSFEKIKNEVKRDSALKNTLAEIRSKAHTQG